MFIVPLASDKIETSAGATYTVLSYTKYKDGPMVYVQSASVDTKGVPFSDIAKISKIPVQLTPGKLFTAASHPKSRIPLPQKDDKVKFNKHTVKVHALKLHQKGHLEAGLLVVGDNMDTGERVTVKLSKATGIERADRSQTDISELKHLYSDYLGSSKS